jgi:hypothetical protein
MTNTQLNELRRLITAVADCLKDCKTHVRGISAYRADADGLAYAASKLYASGLILRQNAESLERLAGEISVVVDPSSATDALDNKHVINGA